MDDFKKELLTTLELSSLKGVSRVIRATSSVLRVIWAVSVLMFFSICVYHVSTVIITFLSYPKVVTVSRKHLNFLDPDKTVPFPTVAVCNANPFTSNRTAFEESGALTPKEYYQKVLEKVSCDDCLSGENLTMQLLRTTLMTNRGYYQTVGHNTMAKVSHNNLIAQCMAIILKSSSYVGMPCDLFAASYTFVHPDLGLCYAYDAMSTPDNIVQGYSFLLYLDGYFDNTNSEFDPLYLAAQSVGAAVYLFNPNTVPTWIGTHALASTGKVTMNFIGIDKIERLSTPYSERECVDPKKKSKVLYTGKYYDYDSMHCYGQCATQYVIDHCNCSDLFMLQSPEREPPKYEYCGSLNLPKEQLFENMECSERVKHAGSLHCSEICKEQCLEVKYSLQSSATKWPLPSQVGTIYQNLIKGSVYEDKYIKKEDIYNSLAAGYNNVSELDRLLALKAIEDNFASVYVYIKDSHFSHMKDEIKLDIGALISLLGGSLNLWSGITMLVCVEILDFLIRVLNKKSMQTSKTGPKTLEVKERDL